MDYSLSGSSVHRNFQAGILEWVAISFSRGASWPRDGTCIACIGRFFIAEPPGKPPCCIYSLLRSQKTRMPILRSPFLLQGCLNKLRPLSQNTNHTLGAWKPQKLLPHSSGARNQGYRHLWMECLQEPISWVKDGPLFAVSWQKGPGSCLGALISLMRKPPSWCNHLPKAPLLTPSPWGLGFNTRVLTEDTDIHSRINTLCKLYAFTFVQVHLENWKHTSYLNRDKLILTKWKLDAKLTTWLRW